jgi:hypothetical protein
MVENGTAVSDSLVDFHVMFKDDVDRYLMGLYTYFVFLGAPAIAFLTTSMVALRFLAGCLERVGEFQRKIEDVRKKLVRQERNYETFETLVQSRRFAHSLLNL